MSDILQTIVARKRDEIERAKRQLPATTLQERLSRTPEVRDFSAALRNADGVALIAEVKKASPSAGVIREDFDPVQIARTYEQHGAAAISVLTDEPFFQGSLDDLQRVRRAVSVPVLRKDFILDPYQVLEARVAGADCILLIAECLDDRQLEELFRRAAELGMQSLVEIYEPESLDRVLRLDPPLLGINNRNLKTFAVDVDHTVRLAEHVPPGTLLVSESGIRSRDDVHRLKSAGVGAILVGETLMRADDIGAKVAELAGV